MTSRAGQYQAYARHVTTSSVTVNYWPQNAPTIFSSHPQLCSNCRETYRLAPPRTPQSLWRHSIITRHWPVTALKTRPIRRIFIAASTEITGSITRNIKIHSLKANTICVWTLCCHTGVIMAMITTIITDKLTVTHNRLFYFFVIHILP